MDSMEKVIDILNNFGATEFGFLVLTSFAIMFGGLGFVYIFGRMLGITTTDKSKNTIGLVSMIFLSFLSTIIYDNSYNPNLIEYIKTIDVLIFISIVLYKVLISSVFYVVIGFKFYNRLDHWIDKKLPDTEEDIKLKKPKKKLKNKKDITVY